MIKLIKPQTIAGFIVSNHFMTVLHRASIRQALLNQLDILPAVALVKTALKPQIQRWHNRKTLQPVSHSLDNTTQAIIASHLPN